jgi:hypothetical protein
LGARWEAVYEEWNEGECSPGCGEGIWVDEGIDWLVGKRQGGTDREWVILDIAILANFTRFRYDRKGRRLKRTQKSFKILVRNGPDVTSFDDLVFHNSGEFFFELGDGLSIRRGLGRGYVGKADDETVAETGYDVCIFFVDASFL